MISLKDFCICLGAWSLYCIIGWFVWPAFMDTPCNCFKDTTKNKS